MQSDNDFMQLAVRLATENVLSGQGGPFGAVIVKDQEVVATGVNLVTASNDPTAHAEVNAIRAACKALGTFQLPGCVLYTSCEPCPMCLGAIYWVRLDSVVYGNTCHDAAAVGFDDHFIYEELSVPPGERSYPCGACCRNSQSRTFAPGRNTSRRSCTKRRFLFCWSLSRLPSMLPYEHSIAGPFRLHPVCCERTGGADSRQGSGHRAL